MKKNNTFILSPGAALKLQHAVRRSPNGGMSTIEWLSEGCNFDLVDQVARGLARIQTIDPEEHVVIVDRKALVSYPEFIGEPLRVYWEHDGPSSYDVTKLQLNFFERSEEDENWLNGLEIFNELCNAPVMERTLHLLDLEAIVARGQEFLNRHFGDKRVLAWKSLVHHKTDNKVILIPRIENGRIVWGNLATQPITQNDLSPCFPS